MLLLHTRKCLKLVFCLPQIDNNSPLERCGQSKKHFQLYCSGCTRRGHLVHSCRVTLPFSGLPINSPYVCLYRPLHPPTHTPSNDFTVNKKPNKPQEARTPNSTARNERNKRQSKSPTRHETHVNKKRNMSVCEETDRRNSKSPVAQRKSSISKDTDETNKKEANKNAQTDINKSLGGAEKASNILVCSANHDKKGNIIQDNEVSDTSDIVTSARIYVTNDIIDKLKTEEGKAWLKETTEKHTVEVESEEIKSFLSIKGKLVDQESFQADLRDWAKPPTSNESVTPSSEGDVQQESKNEQQDWSVIPKNRNNLLRQLSKALNSLKEDIGDPSAIYKELMYLQNRHQKLLNQKVVNPKHLIHNKGHINQMLKKLNMVLIGQAGLADGSAHLNELYSIQEKLMNLRQKNIPTELRKEIGQHYGLIFTAFPRSDYLDLLKMYHMAKQTSMSMKKKKKAFKLNPKLNRLKKKVNSIPNQPIQNGNEEKFEKVDEKMGPCNDPHLMQKLAFYHKRLQSSRPAGAELKKTRIVLVRKLHRFIVSMFTKEKMSSKTLKKIRRAQEQAQLFLANV